MALPTIGFDIQDLIDDGRVYLPEPSRRNFPSAINDVLAGTTVTITFTPVQMPGELFDVVWGDGSQSVVAAPSGAHTYTAGAGLVDIIVYPHGSTNWFINREVTIQ